MHGERIKGSLNNERGGGVQDKYCFKRVKKRDGKIADI